MRISQNTEWAILAALILYVAFTPGFPVVRQFLSTGVGKAVGLTVIVATWKYVSPAIALLLTVNFVRCSGMRESMEDGSGSTSLPPNTSCPPDYTYVNGQCKNASGGSVAAITTPPPAAAPPASPPPPPSPPPMPSPPASGGFQPDMKEKENFAPF